MKVLRDTGCTGMLVDRALIPDSMVIPGSSGSLQMVDQTLMDVPLANVYLDSPYYKVHCKVMCARCLADPDSKAEDQGGARARTSAGNNNDNKGKED